MSDRPPYKRRRGAGFARASSLLQKQIKQVGVTRGFAVSRLLTHWTEIVGEDIATSAQPVNVSYGRQGFGATLTVLVSGAVAPMMQMREPEIRGKVNACYGYNAISRIRFTQTAPTGFAEGQAAFAAKPKAPESKAPNAAEQAEGQAMAQDVTDPALREALASLGAKVLSKRR